MKKILGINISHHFSTCIYENNNINNLWYESRYVLKKENTIIKDPNTFYLSIFKNINFKPDLVVYSSYMRHAFNKYFLKNATTDEEHIEIIQKQLDNPPYYFNKYNHHIYHALSGFYFSNMEEAMSIVIDGGGAMPFNDNYQEMESIFYINKKNIIKLFQHLSNAEVLKEHEKQIANKAKTVLYEKGTEYEFSSLTVGGKAFSKACLLINFKGHQAGKLMGLSSYGYSKNKYNLNYEHVEIAKKIQEETFDRTCNLIEKAYNYRKIKNFILSGGYFLNCTNNFKYVKKYTQFNFFVDPVASDAGTAIGACIYHENYK